MYVSKNSSYTTSVIHIHNLNSLRTSKYRSSEAKKKKKLYKCNNHLYNYFIVNSLTACSRGLLRVHAPLLLRFSLALNIHFYHSLSTCDQSSCSGYQLGTYSRYCHAPNSATNKHEHPCRWWEFPSWASPSFSCTGGMNTRIRPLKFLLTILYTWDQSLSASSKVPVIQKVHRQLDR